mmetsp:Transcript_30306/g.89888  ORF Transcript_30306/g.89888 Transcript_30306/m.89888 type:complete len:93 (+) Transcript_30306:1024-1302(+)
MQACQFIQPPNQVVNRCRCTDEQLCGEEQRRVLELLQEGKLPHHYDFDSQGKYVAPGSAPGQAGGGGVQQRAAAAEAAALRRGQRLARMQRR